LSSCTIDGFSRRVQFGDLSIPIGAMGTVKEWGSLYIQKLLPDITSQKTVSHPLYLVTVLSSQFIPSCDEVMLH
jgi:hypothetical protein